MQYANVTAFRNSSVSNFGDAYGDKILTPYQVRINNDSRWLRVYAICYSNAASLYVNFQGVRHFLRTLAPSQA